MNVAKRCFNKTLNIAVDKTFHNVQKMLQNDRVFATVVERCEI